MRTYRTVKEALDAYLKETRVMRGDGLSMAIVCRDELFIEFVIGDEGEYVNACKWSTYSDVLKMLSMWRYWFAPEWADFTAGCKYRGHFLTEESICWRVAEKGWRAFREHPTVEYDD